MSTLTGHFRITQTAVVELARSSDNSPIGRGIRWAGLPGAAVARDIMDVLSLGHWSDFGQAHHFMRRFDKQSPHGAYEESVTWIQTNAITATQQLARQIERYFPKGFHASPVDQIRGQFMFQEVPWQSLGNAIHCLEDSFAKGHVVREQSTSEYHPGSIEHIKRYTGSEKEKHDEGDEEWWDNASQQFSTSGRQAIESVKALLRIVLDSATRNRNPQVLDGWQGFCNQWLRVSSKLSKVNDHVFELIDRHYVGVRVGNNNVVTLSLDEDGLATSLLDESSEAVLQVFRRLDSQFNSDVDDVAEIYVDKIRSKGGQQAASLKSNRPLIDFLIKVMDEGWTSDGEAACIQYLKNLQ